jgi:hypothetical protein
MEVFNITSPYVNGRNAVQVLLPDKIEAGRTYRTLYVLPVEPGIGGQYGDGLAEIRKANAHNRYSLICVTMAFDTSPWYGAHACNKSIRHEDHVKHVVVPLIENRFPASGKPADRLLIGFSKSGWGAISLLLRDPDFFGAACSWDAPLMMTEKNPKWGSKEYFGNSLQMVPYVPSTLVERQATKLAKGEQRLTVLGHELFGADTRAFHKLLIKLRVPHRFDAGLKFKHTWNSGWVSKALEVFLGETATSQPSNISLLKLLFRRSDCLSNGKRSMD